MTGTAVRRVLDDELVLASATGDTPEGPLTAGACSFTESDARNRARSELAERTALLVDGPSRIVSTETAQAAGGTMLEVIPGCPTPTEWVVAETLSGETVWLPADLVLVRWYGSRELPVRQTSVGSAAHPDWAEAVASGLRECLERYAVRRVWSGTTGLVEITDQFLAAVPAGIVKALRRRGLSADAWLVAATLPAAVVIVMVGSRSHRATFGASCTRSVADGLRHALCEAISVRAAFAAAKELKRNFAMPAEQVDRAIRTSSFQSAFLAYLRRLECPADTLAVQADVRFEDVAAGLGPGPGVTPAVVDLGCRDQRQVVKVVVPAPNFFVPRRDHGYVLAPGYLE